MSEPAENMAMQTATKCPASEDPARTLLQTTKRQAVESTHPAPPRPASVQGLFGKLPAELKVTIVEELDYLSAMSLAATNGYWRLFDPVSKVHVLEKTKFVMKVQWFKKHRFLGDLENRFAQELKAMRQVQSLHRSQERPLHPSEVQSLLPLMNELQSPSVQTLGRHTLESWSPQEGFPCFKCYRVKKTACFKQGGQRVFLSKNSPRYYSATNICTDCVTSTKTFSHGSHAGVANPVRPRSFCSSHNPFSHGSYARVTNPVRPRWFCEICRRPSTPLVGFDDRVLYGCPVCQSCRWFHGEDCRNGSEPLLCPSCNGELVFGWSHSGCGSIHGRAKEAKESESQQ
ncbi:uncharacterized protein BKA78DRAFT_367328 [Phyllosticta capitalensis]|uniref:uncharacterized protein n=1 Tax=Phyllosticta capitalensis TaxID=121624 RepID=UPI00312F0E66